MVIDGPSALRRLPALDRKAPYSPTMPYVDWPPDEIPHSPDEVSCDVSNVPATLTIPTRFIVWAATLILALFGGGQFATIKLVSQDVEQTAKVAAAEVAGAAPNQPVLSSQIAALSAELKIMREQQDAAKIEHDKVWRAVIDYQVEQDRYQRETSPKSHRRPAELERAAQRVQELAKR